jgi:hypothetical protein
MSCGLSIEIERRYSQDDDQKGAASLFENESFLDKVVRSHTPRENHFFYRANKSNRCIVGGESGRRGGHDCRIRDDSRLRYAFATFSLWFRFISFVRPIVRSIADRTMAAVAMQARCARTRTSSRAVGLRPTRFLVAARGSSAVLRLLPYRFFSTHCYLYMSSLVLIRTKGVLLFSAMMVWYSIQQFQLTVKVISKD